MNCQLCQKESEAYLGGRLSDDMKTQVEAHLQFCSDCVESYKLQSIAEKVINQEKGISSDPYLSTRIMAQLENYEANAHKTISPYTRILMPSLIMVSMAAAIFIGVLIGNIYKPSEKVVLRPVEIAMMDDMAIESVNILSNE